MAARIGHVVSEITKKRISDSLKAIGFKPPIYKIGIGRRFISEEERSRRRETAKRVHTGKIVSAETKLKISLGHRRRKKYIIKDDSFSHTKNGYIKDKHGYIYVLQINDLTGVGLRKYKAEHRIVMEEYLGRSLKKNELVHHRNGINDDNRIENLDIVLRNVHFGRVDCPYCQKNFLIK